MDQALLYIDRILYGGVYYLKLDADQKTRPYVVISKDTGYGKDILTFSITSKCIDSSITLPVVINNTISFIRASSPVPVTPQAIISAEFAGCLREDIVDLSIKILLQRFGYITDGFKNEKNKYLHELEKGKFHLYNSNKLFKVDSFKSNKFSSHVEYPHQLSDWNMEQLKEFRGDMFSKNNAELMRKYGACEGRIDYLRQNVRAELKRRKNQSNGK